MAHSMTADISFEPVSDRHLPLLARWLAEPHLREWWGDPETELSYICDMIEGRDTTRPFVFSVDGEPVGYIQYWFVGHHQNASWLEDHPWLGELPSDSIGVDLSIGVAERLSQGIGPAVLRAFVSRLKAQGHSTIIIDPDPMNLRAIRAYEAAGFRPIPELLGRTGDSLIMRHESSATVECA